MATFTKTLTHEANLTADEIDTVTLTGPAVTPTTPGAADPPYVAAAGAATGMVVGFIYRNRSGADQAITWGPAEPPDPDLADPPDGQITLGPGDVWDYDTHAHDNLVVKALSGTGGAYQLIVKTP